MIFQSQKLNHFYNNKFDKFIKKFKSICGKRKENKYPIRIRIYNILDITRKDKGSAYQIHYPIIHRNIINSYERHP